MIDTFDSEARQNALQAAQQTSDAETRMLLEAYAQAPSSYQEAPPVNSVSPISIYARLIKFYGFSEDELKRMHYPRLFAYLREAQSMTQQERKRGDAIPPELAPLYLRRAFDKPIEYRGEVVPLRE